MKLKRHNCIPFVLLCVCGCQWYKTTWETRQGMSSRLVCGFQHNDEEILHNCLQFLHFYLYMPEATESVAKVTGVVVKSTTSEAKATVFMAKARASIWKWICVTFFEPSLWHTKVDTVVINSNCLSTGMPEVLGLWTLGNWHAHLPSLKMLYLYPRLACVIISL